LRQTHAIAAHLNQFFSNQRVLSVQYKKEISVSVKALDCQTNPNIGTVGLNYIYVNPNYRMDEEKYCTL
jgi:hypothetical protein